MQHHGVAHIANSILNEIELDKAVASLTWLREQLVIEQVTLNVHRMLKRPFSSTLALAIVLSPSKRRRDCSKLKRIMITSLPLMDLVTDSLKHDDYVSCLNSIFEPPETVELTDEGAE
ncbi:hypothetical protein HanPI659440_Chr08g0307931 [Helianthus annuus]|nr:hypothetical protein HanPI659440_Chr08g0307931 [Helianthus annuus]